MSSQLYSVLIDAAKQNYQNFMHNVWTALGSVMVAIGWVLTSVEARKFIINNASVKWILIWIILAFLLVHVAVIIWHRYKSEQLLKMLGSTEFFKSKIIEQSHLEIYCIPLIWVYVTAIMNSALLLFLIYLIFEV